MKKHLIKLLSLALALSLALSLAACGGGEGEGGKAAADDIVNGDFEDVSTGKWVGWTKEDAAFNFRGVVSDEKINAAPMEKSGQYYFAGSKGGNPVMKGTLTSDPFKLGGNGFITFKIGAGKDPEKCYVEFIESGTDTVLAKVGNTDCDGIFITDHLLTKVVDLSAHIGKTIYIRITDNDDGSDFAYINVDAFKVCKDDAEVAAAQAEYAKQIETYGEKPFVEDETATTIENGGFETGDLTGWKILEGNAINAAGIVPTSQYYWTDRSVYGEGEYYFDGNNNGSIPEANVGAIRSQKFTLAGDGYITFMIGAGNGGSYVALCDGNTDEELIKVTNEFFSDPSLALTLLRVYMDAHDYIGRVVYLKVVDCNDGSNGGFAFICVDDFRVSLTADEVAALEVEQLEKAQNETYTGASYDDLTALRNYYNTYPHYPVPLQSLTLTAYAKNQVVDCGTVDVTGYIADAAASFGSEAVTDIAVTKVTAPDGTEVTEGFNAVDMTAPGAYTVTYAASYNGKTAETSFTVIAMADHNNVANGGFEAGNLAGWTVLTDTWGTVDGQPTGVISGDTWWGEELPFNQEGVYHLDGWSNGIGEGDTWKVRSTNFTLAGSGFISVRMGGHAAAVHVYKADGTEIGYFKQTRFADTAFPHIGQGGSWADMAVYVMDLSQYVGEELYIELCDEAVDGWAVAFFDDVVTYYETAPDVASMADTVMDGHTAEEQPAQIQIPWQTATNLASGEQPGEDTPAEPAGPTEPDEPAELTADVINGGFETGDLTGWTVLTDGWAMTDGKPAGVIDAATWWGEELPYNQQGNYHLDGWNTGIDEGSTWKVRSSNFILSGSGFISVRMGGNAAAVHVYKADGTEIGYFKQTRFSDTAFPHIGQGGSWADMAVYVMDLSGHIGEELYIELCDEAVDGWAQAFFDDVVTNYETAPDVASMADTVMDGHTAEEQPAEIQIPWQTATNLIG